VLWLGLRVAHATEWPNQTEGDLTLNDYACISGDKFATLKLHYTTIGTPRQDAQGHVTNAVLLLHGTGGTGKEYLQPDIADHSARPRDHHLTGHRAQRRSLNRHISPKPYCELEAANGTRWHRWRAVHKASRPKSSSQVTLCWRKADSNPQSRSEKGVVPRRAPHGLPVIWPARAALMTRGTRGSNPASSSGESIANLAFGGV